MCTDLASPCVCKLLSKPPFPPSLHGGVIREAWCREKKLAAKAQGRRHASSDEDESEEEAAESDGGGSAGEQDPFFQHEDNPFDDPFFRVCSHAGCHPAHRVGIENNGLGRGAREGGPGGAMESGHGVRWPHGMYTIAHGARLEIDGAGGGKEGLAEGQVVFAYNTACGRITGGNALQLAPQPHLRCPLPKHSLQGLGCYCNQPHTCPVDKT